MKGKYHSGLLFILQHIHIFSQMSITTFIYPILNSHIFTLFNNLNFCKRTGHK